jgi:hypothetical protein
MVDNFILWILVGFLFLSIMLFLITKLFNDNDILGGTLRYSLPFRNYFSHPFYNNRRPSFMRTIVDKLNSRNTSNNLAINNNSIVYYIDLQNYKDCELYYADLIGINDKFPIYAFMENHILYNYSQHIFYKDDINSVLLYHKSNINNINNKNYINNINNKINNMFNEIKHKIKLYVDNSKGDANKSKNELLSLLWERYINYIKGSNYKIDVITGIDEKNEDLDRKKVDYINYLSELTHKADENRKSFDSKIDNYEYAYYIYDAIHSIVHNLNKIGNNNVVFHIYFRPDIVQYVEDHKIYDDLYKLITVLLKIKYVKKKKINIHFHYIYINTDGIQNIKDLKDPQNLNDPNYKPESIDDYILLGDYLLDNNNIEKYIISYDQKTPQDAANVINRINRYERSESVFFRDYRFFRKKTIINIDGESKHIEDIDDKSSHLFSAFMENSLDPMINRLYEEKGESLEDRCDYLNDIIKNKRDPIIQQLKGILGIKKYNNKRSDNSSLPSSRKRLKRGS